MLRIGRWTGVGLILYIPIGTPGSHWNRDGYITGRPRCEMTLTAVNQDFQRHSTSQMPTFVEHHQFSRAINCAAFVGFLFFPFSSSNPSNLPRTPVGFGTGHSCSSFSRIFASASNCRNRAASSSRSDVLAVDGCNRDGSASFSNASLLLLFPVGFPSVSTCLS